MDHKIEIEYVPIEKIVPYKQNPRKNDKAVEIVKKSIQEFGFKVPIILDNKNEIIAGHTRLKAAIKLSLKEVPVIRADGLSPEQVKAFRLMDNKSNEYADWDRDLLEVELEDLKGLDFDLELTGFSDRELNQLINYKKDEDFDVDEEINRISGGPRRVKTGEIWKLGEHKLIIGDCVHKDNWKNLLGSETFDFMFTDPPYRLAYTKNRFKGKTKTKKGFGFRAQRLYLGVIKRGGVPEFDEWLKLANDYQNKKGANLMIFENWRNTRDLWGAMEKYWKIKNMVIWWLPNRHQGFSRKYLLFNKYDIAMMAEKGDKEFNSEHEQAFEDYLKDHGQKLIDQYEVALFGSKGDSPWERSKKTNTLMITDHIAWTADNAKSGSTNKIFGTKPIQVLIPYIKILSKPDDIVMEPFGGSGSTLIACEILGRKCRCIEIEPIYAEIILKRWEDFTGQKAIKI